MLPPTVYAALTLLAVAALTRASYHEDDADAANFHFEEYFDLHDENDFELMLGKRSVDDESVNEKRLIRPICSNSNDELCCGKKVFRGQFDYGAQCCGDHFYDTASARCCNATILLANDYNVQCCGADLYNQNKQLCCNGKVYDIQSNQQCCDTAAYNPLKQICCNGTLSVINGKVLSCCVKKPYEPSKSHCINGSLVAKPDRSGLTQVCGSAIIDFRKQICCENKPLTRPNEPTTVCCGAATVSASKQLCCNGTVISKPSENAQCCLKAQFDPNKQVCCSGKVYKRPENSVGTSNYCQPRPVFAEAKDARYSPYFDCCGDQLFTDYKTQLCCNNHLYSYRTTEEKNSYACCASKAYKTTDQICCQDTLSKGVNLRCCGRKTYDLNDLVCCGDVLYKHDNVPANKCCKPLQTVRPIGPIMID